MMSESALDRYLTMLPKNPGGGGMPLQAAAIWDWLLRQQLEADMGGGMAEIGVFHGFGASLMAGYLRENEPLLLVDPTAGPDYWKKTIAEVNPGAAERATYLKTDSMKLSYSDHRPLFAGTRFFHIDGEHSYDAAASDLEFAADCIAPYGMVVVDDFFSPSCAGITQAVFDFVGRQPCKLSIFLLGFNKAYLCMNRYLGFYRKATSQLPVELEKRGYEVELSAGGFAHERTYVGIRARQSGRRYQLVGRYTDDPADLLSSTNRF